jgi:prevent-host-death family protein
MKATHLRANLFKVLDKAIKTGKPVEVESKGRRFKIIPLEAGDKLANLKPHPGCFNGELDELIKIDWLKEWRP